MVRVRVPRGARLCLREEGARRARYGDGMPGVVVDGAYEILGKVGREARWPFRVERRDARAHLDF